MLRGGGKSRTESGAEFSEGSIDAICVLDDSHFVSGGDSGTIALWSTGKKKAIFSVKLAHGVDPKAANLLPSEEEHPSPRWITALAAIRGTNLFASGSWDGRIRLWAIDEQLRGFKPAGEIEVSGFVNAIQMLSLPEGNILSAAVGREPRLGRWMASKGVANGLFTATLDLANA